MCESLNQYQLLVGKKVIKRSGKPFKSMDKINTVVGITTHTQTGKLGFVFQEDESVVECWRCKLAE